MLILLKIEKPTTLQQVTGWKISNLVLKRILELSLKISPLKKILEFQDWKKTAKLTQKKPLKPEIKTTIENLKGELYQLENKQAKGTKLGTNVR